MRFAYTMVFVRDVRASAQFYADALGLPLDHMDDDGSYAEFDTGSTKLGLVSNDHARAHVRAEFRENRISEPPAGFELYLETDDVDSAVQTAVAAGATLVGGPAGKPWGGRAAYVRDPDGVLIELASRSK